MADDFYIMSLSATRGDLLVWWRPNNNGYTARLDDAGRYSRERVEASPAYYNNGEHTLAIPCDEVEKLIVKVVSSSDENLATLTAKRFMMTTDRDAIDDRECRACGEYPHSIKLGLKIVGEAMPIAKAGA